MSAASSAGSTSLKRITLMGLLVTFGIVFGDIGTSPLYVMKAIVRANSSLTPDYILGAVSCIFWTLTIQTSVKYVLIALRADNHGEGGILALYSLIKRSSHKWIYGIAAVGAATLVADGVITPAVTVTSAVEGLRSLSPDIPVIPIVLTVIALIFVIQGLGTNKIGKWFGPVMLLWFLSLGVFGTVNIASYPAILKSFNPYYAYMLLTHYPEWFLILGAVFLCTTGAEALYSDLGHCGRKNISAAWLMVKIMLMLNYLGQGAWIIANQQAATSGNVNPFYAIVPEFLLPFEIILATMAAIIASQALISGSFTIFSEAINLRFWPRLRIKYPSVLKGQLFIPAINIFLFLGCVVTVLLFKSSDNMEAAYGLAITITMLMTTFLLTIYLLHKGIPRWIAFLFLIIFTAIEGTFFAANLFKFMHGGWYTIIIAGVLATVIFVWYNGERVRESFKEFNRISSCVDIITDIGRDNTIAKYASNLVFISHAEHPGHVESKIIYSIVNKSPKRADHYWFMRIVPDNAPETLEYRVDEIYNSSIYCISVKLGYRVQPKLTVYLRQIVENLVAAGQLDLRSCYESLRKRDIPGEFHFVVIRRLFSPSSVCTGKVRFLMKTHGFIARHTMSDVDAFGLDVCNLAVENVPLILNNGPQRRITLAEDA